MFRKSGSSFIILIIVVDDLTMATNSRDMLDEFKANMSKAFDVKFFGELKTFLGWEITRSE